MVSVALLYLGGWASLLIYWARSKTPYFPIEISRCAYYKPNPLRFASLSLPLVLLIFREYTIVQACALWVAMMLISYFDDVRHWALHMVGVAFLALFFLMSCTRIQVLLMTLVYGSRLLIKAYALLIYEECPLDVPSLTEYGLLIMRDGKTCDERTLQLFRVCGVLQWTCFGIAAIY